MCIDGGRERSFERIAAGIRTMIDRHGRNAPIGRKREARRVGSVADDGHDLTIDLAVADRIEYRAHVRPAAGDQDNQPLHVRGSAK